MPTLSILMTAYNRGNYIADAIESVLSQSFTDFELIIVDDASTDHTAEIVRSYTCDERVRFSINERNLGDYPNRNRAASLARGDYLKYLDSDDVLYPGALDLMVNAMRDFPVASLGLVRPKEKTQLRPVLLTPEQAFRKHFFGGGLFGVGPSGAIILTSAFRQLGGFGGRQFIGDIELWLRLATRRSVITLPDTVVFWREHSAQQIAVERHLFPYGTAAYYLYVQALSQGDCPLTAAERTRALERVKSRYLRSLLRIALIDRNPAKAWRIMRNTKISVADLRFLFLPQQQRR